jgi:hypothetical protein
VPVFDEFVAKIGDHIGKDKVDSFAADFSTSGTLFVFTYAAPLQQCITMHVLEECECAASRIATGASFM